MRVRLCITAALLVVPLFGCTEASDPLSPDVAGIRSSGSMWEVKEPLATVSTPDIVLLGIQVRSPEFETPLSYQIPLSNGVSFIPLSLPTGKGYELDVRGYDRYGEETFVGKSAIEYVNVGVNKRLAVELLPSGKGERAGATFEVYGEEPGPEGLRLVIEADRKEVAEGESLILSAYGIDRDGRRIELDPARLHWSMEDPRGGRFDIDPMQPRGPHCSPGVCEPWMRWHAATLVEESRRLRVTVDHFTAVIEIAVVPNGYVDISAGSNVTCAVRRYGGLYCWGGDRYGMLGTGNVTPPDLCNPEFSTGEHCSVRPMAVAGTRMYSAVSVGGFHACAIESNTGAAFCWGQNGAGQLGIPTASPWWSNEPVAVSPPAGASGPLAFASISAGGALTCGITTTGDEYCWGHGYGSEPVLGWQGWASVGGGGPAADATSVAAGYSSCRMDRTSVWCDRALSPGTQAYPWTFLGQATTATHMCGIAGTMTLCWGDNNTYGKLGNGSTFGNLTEVIAPAALNSVATGSNHSCGLAGNVAYCWGSNYNGELGINSLQGGSSTPLQVRTAQSTTPEWVKISTGSSHTCAIDTDGEAWCWGMNYMGQLGNGGSLDYIANDVWKGVIVPVRTVGP